MARPPDHRTPPKPPLMQALIAAFVSTVLGMAAGYWIRHKENR